ncbi:MAG: L,D-transpeptidase [Actinobacteria bacterium]|nr:L,D-transpeptidase [Actinomycetota bacterium]
MLRRTLRAGSIAALVVLALAAPAAADRQRAVASSVTLSASPTAVTYGDQVTLSGQTNPPTAGDTVDILDAANAVVVSAVTGSSGAFEVGLRPSATVTLHASWQGADSATVTVQVQAVVAVRLGAVRLFDTVRVTGRVQPARPGEAVTVTLRHAGRVVATHTPTMGSAGGFKTGFQISLPGTYRARASFAAADLLRGSDASRARTTPLPTLSQGDHGIFVQLLERRLRALAYHITGVNRGFDFRTADAVLAFREVQGMDRNFLVTSSVWRALARPRRLRPRGSKHGFHIEVNQTKQVLFTVQDGAVTAIVHVSTGKPSTPTYDGAFSVRHKLAGYSSLLLYYPSFFDGNRAIHGWPDVPTYAASHGCVRVPMWTARWIFHLDPVGTRVLVYHASR